MVRCGLARSPVEMGDLSSGFWFLPRLSFSWPVCFPCSVSGNTRSLVSAFDFKYKPTSGNPGLLIVDHEWPLNSQDLPQWGRY